MSKTFYLHMSYSVSMETNEHEIINNNNNYLQWIFHYFSLNYIISNTIIQSAAYTYSVLQNKLSLLYYSTFETITIFFF